MGPGTVGTARGVSGSGVFRRGLLVFLAVSALAPLALLLLTSVGNGWFAPALWPPAITLESWRAVAGAGRLGHALGTSLTLGLATGVLSVVVGAPLGRALAGLFGWRRQLAVAMVFLPVATPPVGLGVGLHVSALSFGLAGSWGGVLGAHLIPAAGYAALYFLGVFSVFDARAEEAARSLGATPLAVAWRVTLPMLRRPLLDGFLLGYLVSWAQVGLTLVIGQGNVRSLPMEVFGYLLAGQDRYAATGAVLLVLPPLLTIGLVKLAAGRAGAFQV